MAVCCYCKKEVKEKDAFVTEGSYPSYGKLWQKSNFCYYTRPEAYGSLFHKACFIEYLKKKGELTE
jgi:hypothetical protein